MGGVGPVACQDILVGCTCVCILVDGAEYLLSVSSEASSSVLGCLWSWHGFGHPAF